MFSRKSTLPRSLLAGFLIVTLGIATYAFAASNTVPESGAGDGTGTVSGYTISAIVYTLDAVNPEEVDSFAMEVTPDGGENATTVQATVDGGTTWIDCAGGGTSWTCTLGVGVTLTSISSLQVVASQ